MASKTPKNSSFSMEPGSFYSAEFQSLREKIQANAYIIIRLAKTVEKHRETIGTPGDSKGFRLGVQTDLSSAKKIIEETTSHLKALKSLTSRSTDDVLKLSVHRLEADFQTQVTIYSDIQQKTVGKLRATFLPPAASPTVSLHSVEDGNYGGGTTSNSNYSMGRKTLMMVQDQEAINIQEMQSERDLLAERARAVQRVEEDIVDINSMMTTIASMVHEQGETVDSIENNVEVAEQQVEAGTVELHQAEILQTKRRKCTLFIAIGGLVVLIVLIIVVVTQFKK